MDWTLIDILGFYAWCLVFPVYHVLYPWLGRRLGKKTTLGRIDAYRRSWIEWVLEGRRIVDSAQQTRNLTMVNSLLASSSLILLGFTANIVIQFHGEFHNAAQPDPVMWKLYLVIIVLAVSFSYFINALRHLGHFNITIGADPKLVDELEGSSVDYFTDLIARASHRYTMGVRTLFSAFPLFLWLFSSWLFLAVVAAFALKFLGFQDFARGRQRAPGATPTDAGR